MLPYRQPTRGASARKASLEEKRGVTMIYSTFKDQKLSQLAEMYEIGPHWIDQVRVRQKSINEDLK